MPKKYIPLEEPGNPSSSEAIRRASERTRLGRMAPLPDSQIRNIEIASDETGNGNPAQVDDTAKLKESHAARGTPAFQEFTDLTEPQKERMWLIDFATAKWEAGVLSDEQYDAVCVASEIIPRDSPLLETPLPTPAEFVINNRRIKQAILAAAPDITEELRNLGQSKAR